MSYQDPAAKMALSVGPAVGIRLATREQFEEDLKTVEGRDVREGPLLVRSSVTRTRDEASLLAGSGVVVYLLLRRNCRRYHEGLKKSQPRRG